MDWYTLGYATLTISCRNSLSPGVLDLKDKISPCMLKHVTCVGIRNKKEIWAGRTFGLCCVGWTTQVKTRKAHCLKNVKMCCKWSRIQCEHAEHLWIFLCMWNVANLYKLWKFFPHPSYMGDSAKFFQRFEVLFIIWIHLGCSISMSPTLGVCACFWWDHMCFNCAFRFPRAFCLLTHQVVIALSWVDFAF